jgi:dienelactone hydrolase
MSRRLAFGFRVAVHLLIPLLAHTPGAWAISAGTSPAPPAQSLALPAPTGRFPVGTTVAYLTDERRKDADFTSGRPITVQIWYPSTSSKGATAPYLIEPGLGKMLRRDHYYEVPDETLAGWETLRTHALLDARPVPGRHPLLLFSVGLGVIRANYTSLAEELASQGTIVALVESPFQGAMLVPDGREIVDTRDRYGEPEGHRRGVAEWSRDLSFALDALRRGGISAAARRVAAMVDWSRVGAAGHSTGGLVAVATCERDARVSACINMDGGTISPDGQPLAEFVTRGLGKPALLVRSHPLYSDEDLARRNLTREHWRKRGEAGDKALAELASRSGTKLTVASIAPSGHFTFSDAPFVMPGTITRFGGQVLSARRSWTIVTQVLRAYLDQEMAGHDGALEALARQFPELTLGSAKP